MTLVKKLLSSDENLTIVITSRAVEDACGSCN